MSSEALFRTERLSVRLLAAYDIDALHAVYGDAETMRPLGDGETLSRERCADWVGVTHENYAKRGYGMSVLELRESGEVVGFCGLVHPGGQPEAEIKYALHKSRWGSGLGTEAVRGMLAYGVEHFDLRRVIATVAPRNHASQHVLRKVGMKHVEPTLDEDGSTIENFVWDAG